MYFLENMQLIYPCFDLLLVQIKRLQRELTEAQKQIEELHYKAEELERLKRDQEDLLELLADQDLKLGNFKLRLMALGEKVTNRSFQLKFK